MLDAVELNGSLTEKNIANQVFKSLSEFGLESKLLCVTADNAANNNTTAQHLEQLIPKFVKSEHLLGCVGHILNLAAKDWLKSSGVIMIENWVNEQNADSESDFL